MWFGIAVASYGRFGKGYVYLVAFVAHFQIAVDAVLVDVRDAGHIGNALIRCGTDAACQGEQVRKEKERWINKVVFSW